MEEITVGDLVGWKLYVGELFGIVTEIKDGRALVDAPAVNARGWVDLDKLYIQHEEMGF
jgi:hypothetical protein